MVFRVWYLIISIPDLCLFYFLLHVFHSKVISWNICKKERIKNRVKVSKSYCAYVKVQVPAIVLVPRLVGLLNVHVNLRKHDNAIINYDLGM